ncbi:MAG: sulfite exporter TauE/SafE family protein [Bacteroidia bacterium]
MLTNALFSGFLLGLVGSLHCVGMCGPLMLLLPPENRWQRVLSTQSMYHLGRSITYVVLGGVAGILFAFVDVQSFSQKFSLVLGGIFLIFWIWGVVKNKNSNPGRFQKSIERWFSRIIRGGGRGRWFLGGMLNGLLPCGLVYGALLASLGTESQLGVAWFMLGFGIGNSPLLISVVFAKSLIMKRFTFAIGKVLSIWLLIMALFFLLRGANLGIPFLSPKFSQATGHTTSPSCCH